MEARESTNLIEICRLVTLLSRMGLTGRVLGMFQYILHREPSLQISGSRVKEATCILNRGGHFEFQIRRLSPF